MQQVALSRIHPRRRRLLPRTVVLAALLCGIFGAAHADQYDDVSALLQQGQAQAALTKSEAYIASNPRDPQMRFLRGVILNSQGRQDEAIEAYTALTREFPELPEPYNNLAALYAGKGRFDQAREALETALQLNPNYATARENLGDVYVRLAAQAYQRAQQLDKANTSAAPKLATLRQVFPPAAAPVQASTLEPAKR